MKADKGHSALVRRPERKATSEAEQRDWVCDRCGTVMYESSCKIICLNCGNRYDCSDLNLYFD